MTRPDSELIAPEMEHPMNETEQELRQHLRRVIAEVERLDNLRTIPCPTCGGTRVNSIDANDCPACDAYGLSPSHHCPENNGNCDGRMSWERMAAIVAAVFADETREVHGQSSLLAYLRSIR